MHSQLQRHTGPRGAIQFLDIGSGYPVLYFHGTGAASDAAALLEQPLVDSGCRLIIPNRPGYYDTTPGPAGSVEFCARIACDLLDHLGVSRVAVTGTSGGGMPAAAFARMYPDRTASLLLQCAQSHSWTSAKWLPKGLGPALFLFRNRVFYPFLRWHNFRHARRSHADPKWCMQHMAGDRGTEIGQSSNALSQVESLTEMMLRCAGRPAGIQNDWSILVRKNGVVPHSINAPTLIIHDTADPLVPFCHAESSHAAIRNSQLLVVHAGGHLIWFGKDSEMMHRKRLDFIVSTLTLSAT